MKKPTLKYKVIVTGLLVIFISSCNYTGKKANNDVQNQPTSQAICSKGLSYADCPNPPALHGRIMVHNKTNETFDVKIGHHGNIYQTEQIAPGDGWTFVGVIQGKRLLIATPSVGGGKPFQSSCTVIGNTMHMMNIMPNGFVMVDHEEHTVPEQEGTKETEIIQLPIRKESGHSN